MLKTITKKLVLVALFLVLSTNYAHHAVRNVSKVVLWGHKLHTHTHSYIHWGFQRAFKQMGYDTYWLDHRDNISAMDFSNTLFITEGQVDQGIPLRDDCYYIIHNCKPHKYQHLLNNGRAIILQVYTHDCLERKEPSFSQCFHYNLPPSVIYMPWATDLLPFEIDAVKQQISARKPKQNSATFIGTISRGTFGNQSEVDGFKQACQENGIEFRHGGVNRRSMEENIALMQNALLAPALQGPWQCRQGYIPCRIFKNISYGAMGVTNSRTVYELFDKKILYHENAYQLGKDALKAVKNWSLEDQYELMDLVRDKHTYLNRIESLFSFFEMVDNYKKESK